jgi:hypothetical protein
MVHTYAYMYVSTPPIRLLNPTDFVRVVPEQGDQMRMFKSRPKCRPNPFCQNECITKNGKSSPTMWDTSILLKTIKSKLSSIGRKIAQTGHPVPE